MTHRTFMRDYAPKGADRATDIGEILGTIVGFGLIAFVLVVVW